MLKEAHHAKKNEKNSDASKDAIIKYLPLIKSLAHRFAIYSPPCCDADDLIAVGIMGLLEALEKYDPTIQKNFATYAKHRIRGAMLDELRSLNWVPKSVQDKIKNLGRVYSLLEQVMLRTPTEEELAGALGMELDDFRKMMIQIGPSTLLMLSQKYYESKEPISVNTPIEDPNGITPLSQAISDETKAILADTIKSLPKREAIVISLYYYEEMTMREIGEAMSLSESRVCQIHSDAILHLFSALSSKKLNRKSFKQPDIRPPNLTIF